MIALLNAKFKAPIIIPENKGGAEGHYTSSGALEILNEDIEGKVQIEDEVLYIKCRDFDVIEAPFLNEEGEFEIQLGTIIFTKS